MLPTSGSSEKKGGGEKGAVEKKNDNQHTHTHFYLSLSLSPPLSLILLTRVGVGQQRADGQQHLGHGERGRPLVFEDVEADLARRVDVAVVDARLERDLVWGRDGGERVVVFRSIQKNHQSIPVPPPLSPPLFLIPRTLGGLNG